MYHEHLTIEKVLSIICDILLKEFDVFKHVLECVGYIVPVANHQPLFSPYFGICSQV